MSGINVFDHEVVEERGVSEGGFAGGDRSRAVMPNECKQTKAMASQPHQDRATLCSLAFSDYQLWVNPSCVTQTETVVSHTSALPYLSLTLRLKSFQSVLSFAAHTSSSPRLLETMTTPRMDGSLRRQGLEHTCQGFLRHTDDHR
jgi:hypothetical protein